MVDNSITKKGYFDFNKEANYVITDTSLESPWEFIYENRDVLLRVDQNGLVSAQARPPEDIMLFKREYLEKYSKWLVWIKCNEINDGIALSNFNYPKLNIAGEKASSCKITFSPESALYEYSYEKVKITTEVLVPKTGTHVIMKTTIKNSSNKELNFVVTPALCPFINVAQLAPWDKPEWYLKSGAMKKSGGLTFSGKLFSPEGDVKKRRLVTFNSFTNSSDFSYEMSLEKFIADGCFSQPQSLTENSLRLKSADLPTALNDENSIFGYPPCYVFSDKVLLKKNESKDFVQVLSMQNSADFSDAENNLSQEFLSNERIESEKAELKAFYSDIFSKRKIKTNDKMLDYYVNSFLPLQMYWVGSLDRGWPTGMRGVRDAANDFMGMLQIDSDWSRKILLELFDCQKSNGYFPRQISTKGKLGKHDLRNYVDGGAFVFELLNEYINFTSDISVLYENVSWLDDDKQSTVFTHVKRIFDFYLAKDNIGQHGLIKIFEGDWLDAVNKAGLEGKGETVTVTNQIVWSLKKMVEIINWLVASGKINNQSAESLGIGMNLAEAEKLIKLYSKEADTFKDNLLKHAYNEKGYFNGDFTDNGNWLFSPKDEDGESRIYGVANSYAIISGVARDDVAKSVLSNVERLRCEMGYRLFQPALGRVPIKNVGRIASGDMSEGIWENGNVYNHGSNGFLLRALSVLKKSDTALEVLNFMLPFSQDIHPISKTLSAPYALVNCYQQIPLFMHRAGMPFLTGTIAMALRGVYNFIFGITYDIDGLLLKPCVSKKLDGSEVQLTYKKCKFLIKYKLANKSRTKVNGEYISSSKIDCITGESVAFIGKEKFKSENIIEVEYTAE